MSEPTGQMCWRYPYDGAATRDLYVRHSPLERWKPVTDFPHLVVANEPEFSVSAWRTYIALRNKGWVLVRDA